MSFNASPPAITDPPRAFNTFQDTVPPALKPYQDAVNAADNNKQQALAQVTRLQSQLNQTQPQAGGYSDGNGGTFGATDNPAYAAINQQLQRAMALYDSAAREHNDALKALADASQKEVARNDPATRAVAQATLTRAQTDAQRATQEYQEWTQAAPDRKAETAANIKLRNAQAAQADLDMQLQRETDPLRRQQLQQQIDAGKLAITQAQQDLQVSQSTAGNRVTQSNQAVSSGNIGIDQQRAALEASQRANRQAPTDDEVATARGLTNQQSAANLAQTQAQTNQLQLGGLADLDKFKESLRNAYVNGDITMDDVTQQLTARMAGTDVYGATQAAEKASMDRLGAGLTQRQQDTSLVSGARSNLAGLGGSAFGTISGQASKAPHGSGAALAGGYNAMLNDFTSRVGGPSAFATPAPLSIPQLPPMLQKFAAPQPQQAPPPQPQSQSMPLSGAGHVTINIGGGGGEPQIQTSTPPPQPYQGAPNPNTFGSGGMPQLVQNKMPPTTQDVIAMYPEAAKRAGYQPAMQSAGMGSFI